jgi:hypothetical protein
MPYCRAAGARRGTSSVGIRAGSQRWPAIPHGPSRRPSRTSSRSSPKRAYNRSHRPAKSRHSLPRCATRSRPLHSLARSRLPIRVSRQQSVVEILVRCHTLKHRIINRTRSLRPVIEIEGWGVEGLSGRDLARSLERRHGMSVRTQMFPESSWACWRRHSVGCRYDRMRSPRERCLYAEPFAPDVLWRSDEPYTHEHDRACADGTLTAVST